MGDRKGNSCYDAVMEYFEKRTTQPVKYHICGNLRASDGFLHHKRSMEDHVLIVVLKGTLYLRVEGKETIVQSGQYILLEAGAEHEGLKPSEGELSYFWVHFALEECPEENSERTETGTTDAAAAEMATFRTADVQHTHMTGETTIRERDDLQPVNSYRFPKQGQLSVTGRVTTLFRQLLDLSGTWGEGRQQGQLLDYCCSVLLLELTMECRREDERGAADETQPDSQLIREVMDYIGSNCHKQLEPAGIARHFHYHPDYFAALFKKYTGMTLTGYTNRMRIELAKRLLVNQHVSIKEAAYSSGFRDEKYFMRVFKRQEGITPLAYKTAFQKSYINHP